MLFDDRLATVLRYGAADSAAWRTQYRQLIDLLGSMPADADSGLVNAAYERLASLEEELSASSQAAILREPGLRLRNLRMLDWLGRAEPQVAAAAMAMGRLSESEWLDLIPRLPVTARGFLRHRRDLPEGALNLLERLGVGDLVLPQPPAPPEVRHGQDAPPANAEFAPADTTPVEAAAPHDGDPFEDSPEGIGAIVRRIEAFRRAHQPGDAATAKDPRLPLDEGAKQTTAERAPVHLFETDPGGTICWAEPGMASRLVGMKLTATQPEAVARMDETGLTAMAQRLPLRAVRIRLAAAPDLSGDWRIDAAPRFDAESGTYEGYRGRLFRSLTALSPQTAPHSGGPADRLRQVLHELRTPVTAIQGFAEIIQQQLFGPAPNEYRAHAAAIAVDAAKLLAGFDELDRLAKLESRALDLADGRSDMRIDVMTIVQRLDGALRPRSARFDVSVAGSPFTVGFAQADALQLIWRILATLAGAMAPGEVLSLRLTSDGHTIRLAAEMPATLEDTADIFEGGSHGTSRAISAGMFGSGLTFRLARAEAIAAGGSLTRADDTLELRLPALTDGEAGHSDANDADKQGSSAG